MFARRLNKYESSASRTPLRYADIKAYAASKKTLNAPRRAPIMDSPHGHSPWVADESDNSSAYDKAASGMICSQLAPHPISQFTKDQADYSDAEEDEKWVHQNSFSRRFNDATFELEYRRFLRSTTTDPQPTVGHGRSRLGLRPGLLKARRHDASALEGRLVFTAVDNQPPLLYRADDEILYKFTTREPEEVFRHGFKPRGEKVPASLSLYQKYMEVAHLSAFVSTTRDPDLGFLDTRYSERRDGMIHRYTITAPGGIDVVASLRKYALLAQQEVVFWKGIRPEYIDRLEIINPHTREIVRVITRAAWEALSCDAKDFKSHSSEIGEPKQGDYETQRAKAEDESSEMLSQRDDEEDLLVRASKLSKMAAEIRW